MEVDLTLKINVDDLETLKKFKGIENMLLGSVSDKFIIAYENKDGSAKEAIWNCEDLDLAAFICAFLTGVKKRDRDRIINFIRVFPYEKADNMITGKEL